MAKVDDKHKGPSAWERMQPRERVLVMILVGVFIFMSTAVMLLLRQRKLSAIDEEIDDLRQGLYLTRTSGASYKEKLASKTKADSRISTEELAFSTLIEEAQTVAEITANGGEEKASVEVAPGLRMRTYEFDLRSVTLDQLTKFLTHLESKEGHVILTQNLTIRSPSAAEDRLNVDVVIATWQRTGAAEGEEEEG